MKTQKNLQNLKPHEAMFKCPICKQNMAFPSTASLVCENRHCFDLSKYGYINFLQKQPKSAYSKELFESRRRVFEGGFYNELVDVIDSMICTYAGSDSVINILDAGCGEGFFTSKLVDTSNGTMRNMFAIDIEKEAIVMAARFANNVKCFVGDLSNIPLKDDTIDIVLNIFSPANYDEFFRVLRGDGIVIKVVPSKDYLVELRESAKGQITDGEYSNELVLNLFGEKLGVVDMKKVTYTLPLSKAQAADFVTMTPLMMNVNKAKIDLTKISEITIDVDILVGRVK